MLEHFKVPVGPVSGCIYVCEFYATVNVCAPVTSKLDYELTYCGKSIIEKKNKKK